MSRIAVVTDTNAGIPKNRAQEMGIYVVPMPFLVDGNLYYEDVNLTQEQFYEFLKNGAAVSTSQPSMDDVRETFDKALADGNDELIYIPMSSGLSGSCETAEMIAEKYYPGKVFVVDNKRISVTQVQSILDAMHLITLGYSGQQIKDRLLETMHDQTIYITLETLYYLKKGGRITAAAAALGTVLNLKPVLQIQGGKLDAYSKAHGMKAARAAMIKAVQNDLNGRLKEFDEAGDIQIGASYSGTKVPQDWLDQIQKAFPQRSIYCRPLSLSISCHIGEGSLAVTATRIVRS